MSSLSSPSTLRADGISKSYGDRAALTDLSLAVGGIQRVGLLGENGAGKSTLLRLLAGLEHPDRGTVTRPLRTAMLAQEVVADGAAPLSAIIDAAVAPLRVLQQELEASAEALAEGAPDAERRYATALAAAEFAELWTLDARRDELSAGLGVDDLSLARPVDSVSGGQRSRVALAGLLLARPEALLLDEPTNHLDDRAVEYLAMVLRSWRGVVLFASHDRAFLDDVATGLLDIDPARSLQRPGGTSAPSVTRYGGNYTSYLAAKALERERWEAQFASEEVELTRLEESVTVGARSIDRNTGPRDNDRMSAGVKKETLQHQVARRIRNAQGRLDDLTDNHIDRPPAMLRFGGIPHGSQPLEGPEPLLSVEALGLGERLRLDHLMIGPDARLLITGPNGAGKSTLLGLLAGRLAPDTGRVARRRGLRVALLDQDVRWDDPAVSPRTLYRRAVGERRAESLPLIDLGLLASRDLDRRVGSLSIGQQRRMALALIIAQPPHVFLLDEPTNHLSLLLATELEDALGTYPGAVVIASHDRWLRRRWRGRLLRLEDGRVARRTDVPAREPRPS